MTSFMGKTTNSSVLVEHVPALGLNEVQIQVYTIDLFWLKQYHSQYVLSSLFISRHIVLVRVHVTPNEATRGEEIDHWSELPSFTHSEKHPLFNCWPHIPAPTEPEDPPGPSSSAQALSILSWHGDSSCSYSVCTSSNCATGETGRCGNTTKTTSVWFDAVKFSFIGVSVGMELNRIMRVWSIQINEVKALHSLFHSLHLCCRPREKTALVQVQQVLCQRSCFVNVFIGSCLISSNHREWFIPVSVALTCVHIETSYRSAPRTAGILPFCHKKTAKISNAMSSGV